MMFVGVWERMPPGRHIGDRVGAEIEMAGMLVHVERKRRESRPRWPASRPNGF
jgi:hypothetical protein